MSHRYLRHFTPLCTLPKAVIYDAILLFSKSVSRGSWGVTSPHSSQRREWKRYFGINFCYLYVFRATWHENNNCTVWSPSILPCQFVPNKLMIYYRPIKNLFGPIFIFIHKPPSRSLCFQEINSFRSNLRCDDNLNWQIWRYAKARDMTNLPLYPSVLKRQILLCIHCILPVSRGKATRNLGETHTFSFLDQKLTF